MLSSVLLSFFTKEAAELTSQLRPHQQRVLDKLQKSDGVIVAHQVGSGKTLTSIAAGIQSGMPMEVLTPASLVSNYGKEVAKHTKGTLPSIRVRSLPKAVSDAKKGIDVDTSGVLVIDEAHKLRNTGTATANYVGIPGRKAKKRLLLTGTPVYNRVSDIAPLVNIAAGETILPENPTEFKKRFIKETQAKVGLISSLRGIKPGIIKSLKNKEQLHEALVGRIDVHMGDKDNFPSTSLEDVKVPMSKKQLGVYKYHMKEIPFHLRAKIKGNMPLTKQESKGLNTFLTGVRQSSLSPRPYIANMTDQEEDENTPKIQEAANRMIAASKSDSKFKGLAYSNYKAGLNPYARALTRNKIPFRTFTGDMNKKEKQEAVKAFNSGAAKVMLVSSSGTEGLDLKGTRKVQILEPHFNESKIDQVIGRAVRYKSHAHLPTNDRNVHVERYFSAVPKSSLQRIFNKKPNTGADEFLHGIAKGKLKLVNELSEIMAKASEDGS